MNVKNIEKKEKNTASITVEISAEEFESAINKAYLKSRGSISVPGFRKGKAPRKIIESMYGGNVFFDDALDALIPEAYTLAVSSDDLKIAARPAVEDMNIGEDKTVTVVFQVALMPEVTLGEYKAVKAHKDSAEVSDDDVIADIDAVRSRNARIETVERAAKLGDIATIDFEGFLGGVAFDGGKGEGHDLELGSGQFIPGFEDQVVGMSAGEERDINVKFPEEYGAENLAGQDAVFHVKCNAVKEKTLPELDDEFAKDVSEFDTLDEYKNSVREKLTESKAAQVETAFKDSIIETVLAGSTCDIPEQMIAERVDSVVDSYRTRMQQQGIEFDFYLKLMGTDEAGFRAQMHDGCEKEIKKELIFAEIAKAEGYDATEEEIEAKYEELANQYSMKVEDVKMYMSADTIKEQLLFEKAEKLVYDSAIVE